MEPLNDPLKDRMVKQVKPPPHRHLDAKLMFPDKLKRKKPAFSSFLFNIYFVTYNNHYPFR